MLLCISPFCLAASRHVCKFWLAKQLKIELQRHKRKWRNCSLKPYLVGGWLTGTASGGLTKTEVGARGRNCDLVPLLVEWSFIWWVTMLELRRVTPKPECFSLLFFLLAGNEEGWDWTQGRTLRGGYYTLLPLTPRTRVFNRCKCTSVDKDAEELETRKTAANIKRAKQDVMFSFLFLGCN